MSVRALFWLLLAVLSIGHAGAAEPVKFSDALFKKFHHDRCLQCHQFNSKRSNGRSYTSHRSRYLCDNCHAPRLTGLAAGDWMAPPGSKMDYTGLNARETCLLIKRNAPAGDLKTRLGEHLLHDVRVRWALDTGKTPMGQFPTVPGGYAQWAGEVQAWLDGGMVCE